VEDNTARDSHDVRLVHAGGTKSGSYELMAGFRPRERKNVYIFLHCRWQDQIRFKLDAASGLTSIEDTAGDTFTVSSLKSETSAGWTYLKVGIKIVNDPEEVAVSVHLVDDAGNYYYDGDGKSAIDVSAICLSPL
jgi:hypothetical protein